MAIFKPQRRGAYPNPSHPLAQGLILDLSGREGGGPLTATTAPPSTTQVVASSHGARLVYNLDGAAPIFGWPDYYHQATALIQANPTLGGHGGYAQRYGDQTTNPQGSDWATEDSRTGWTPDTVPWHTDRARTVIWHGLPQGANTFHTIFQLAVFNASDALLGGPFVVFNSSNGSYNPWTWGSDGYTGIESRGAGTSGSGSWRNAEAHIALVQPPGGGDTTPPAGATFYLNGIATSHSTSGGILGDNNVLHVGGDNSGGAGGRNFVGVFDRLRVWNRELSAEEVALERALPYEMYRYDTTPVLSVASRVAAESRPPFNPLVRM